MSEQGTRPPATDAAESMGPRIRIAREKAGMSIEQLAHGLGAAAESVRAWEAGERVPRANRLVMMAGMLDVSLPWLLEGREDQRMASGGSPGLDEVQQRLETARAGLAEAMRALIAAEEALAEARARGEVEQEA